MNNDVTFYIVKMDLSSLFGCGEREALLERAPPSSRKGESFAHFRILKKISNGRPCQALQYKFDWWKFPLVFHFPSPS